MKIKLILCIVFVLVIFAACNPSTGPNKKVTNLHIEGTVTYSDTHKPVAGCRVELGVYGVPLCPSYYLSNAYTNEDGRYSIKHTFTGALCGTLTLRVFIEEQLRWSSLNSDQEISFKEGIQTINIEID
ncbi:MAG: hypothetical protein ACFFCW_44195 [Candidatus Hodarchaeota archaeon]